MRREERGRREMMYVAIPGLASGYPPETNRVLDDGINEVFI